MAVAQQEQQTHVGNFKIQTPKYKVKDRVVDVKKYNYGHRKQKVRCEAN